MAADHLFVNGTDSAVADITAATGTTAACAARSVSAASSTSADVASFIASTGAYAVMPTAATSADKINVAFTLLLSAGVSLGAGIANASDLATAAKRANFKLKLGVQEGENLVRAMQE